MSAWSVASDRVGSRRAIWVRISGTVIAEVLLRLLVGPFRAKKARKSLV
jgi:hypothetical protein